MRYGFANTTKPQKSVSLMSVLIRLVLVITILQLSACGSMVGIIDKERNPYHYQPGTSVIVLGSVGESRLLSVQGMTRRGITKFEIPAGSSRRIDAFAWQLEIGDELRLQQVLVSPAVTREFPASHTITIEKEGIYYYGSILSREEQVVLIEKALPELLRVANEKYPHVFNVLDPVNFE